MNCAGELYLDFMVAQNYPEQKPAHKVASNWDLLWFLVPIIGFMFFVMTIDDRYKKKKAAREGDDAGNRSAC